MFAPNPKGQARAVERALEDAKIRPDQLGLLEAHGTGTRLGDKVEADAYGEAFHSRGRDNPVPMGTLKSQIGHTSAASGALGLIKTAFAVSEAILPPMNGGEFPKAEIPFDRLPIALSMEGRPWPAPREGRRRAGVSSFGIGGTNYHLILEEHDNTHRKQQQQGDPLSATSSYPIPSRGLTAQRWRVDLVPLSLSSEKRYPLPGKRLLLVGDEPGLVAAFSRLLVARARASPRCRWRASRTPWRWRSGCAAPARSSEARMESSTWVPSVRSNTSSPWAVPASRAAWRRPPRAGTARGAPCTSACGTPRSAPPATWPSPPWAATSASWVMAATSWAAPSPASSRA